MTLAPRRRGPARVALVAWLLTLPACSDDGAAAPEGEPPTDGAAAAAVGARRVDPAAFPIVYSRLGDSLDLYLTDERGRRTVQLTDGPDQESVPRWSQDGSRIAFTVFAGEDIDKGPSDIYVMDADGTDVRLLTPGDECAANPVWSPDGESLLYVAGECGDGEPGLWVMADDGSDQQRIVQGPVQWPDWSADGRIVYEGRGPARGSDLYLTDSEGSRPARLRTGELDSGTEPSWSPDGSRIAYVAPSGDPGAADPEDWNEDVFVVRADGGGGRRVVDAPGNDHWRPAWSPDGRRLLYSNDGARNEATTLTIVDLQTLRTRPLLAEPCTCLFPDWRH